tara:strand:+ start:1982 stop:2110 length:129 start_codon:yes stop_codon:yes gene_type:complete
MEINNTMNKPINAMNLLEKMVEFKSSMSLDIVKRKRWKLNDL